MAVSKTVKRVRKAKSGSPYLAAAFFCEKTIEDKQDGSISAIRIIDQINVSLNPGTPPDFPSKENRLPVQISALISFKTGDSPGEHTLRLVMVSPTGKKNEPWQQTINLSQQQHGGINLRMNNVIAIVEGGLFWLDVFLDGRRVTRMPIEISIQREQLPPGPTAEISQS